MTMDPAFKHFQTKDAFNFTMNQIFCSKYFENIGQHSETQQTWFISEKCKYSLNLVPFIDRTHKLIRSLLTICFLYVHHKLTMPCVSKSA